MRTSTNQRRAAFGRLLALRVTEGEVSRRTAELVLEDFADVMSETVRGERMVRRVTKRAFRRALQQ